MKLPQILCIIYLLLGMNLVSAQQHFKPGYFITKEGKKTTCFIKDYAWSVSPKEIKYRLSEEGENQIIKTSELNEVGIENILKYETHKVEIDVSSSKIKYLSRSDARELETKELLLQVLVEGDGTLYRYKTSNSARYFYKVNDGAIKHLIYKKHMVTSINSGYDQSFRYQLQQDLKCEGFGIMEISKLEFNKKGLVKLFNAYNNCKNANLIDYTKRKYKGKWNLGIRPGINFSELDISSTGWRMGYSEKRNNFRLGVELEFLLPFNNRNWSVFLEGEYRKTALNTSFNDGFSQREIDLNHKAIIGYLGGRRYFNITEDKLKLFAGGMIIYSVPLGSTVTTRYWRTKRIPNKLYFGAGLGLSYKNKFSAEFRINGNRALRRTSPNINFKNMSFILGYNIF